MTEVPVWAAASPGNRKKPELNIAPVLIEKTSYRVNDFFNAFVLLLLLDDLLTQGPFLCCNG